MNSEQDEERPSHLRWLGIVAGVLLLGIVIVWWPGCRQYPRVTSKESQNLIRKMYSATNKRDQALLTSVEQDIVKLKSEGKLSPSEEQGFLKIIEMAKQGNWQEAQEASFRYAQDQR